jgi:selenocysteine lyase/cysteine desulfurase
VTAAVSASSARAAAPPASNAAIATVTNSRFILVLPDVGPWSRQAARFGGTGVHSATPFHLEDYPHRLEAGTGNVLGITGLYFAQAYIVQRGVAEIYRHEMELFTRLQQGLQAIDGVTLHGTTRLDDRLPVLSFTIVGLDPSDVGTMLDVDYNIAARTGLQCAPLIHQQMGTGERGTVRLSVGPMNVASDVEKAIQAVAEIAADALQRNTPKAR